MTTPKKMADIFLVFPGFDGLHLLHISSFHTFVSFWGYRMSHTFDLVDGKGKETGHTSVLLKQKNTWKTTVVFPGFVAQLLFCVLGREMPLSIPTDGQDVKAFFLPIALREVNFLAGMAQLPEMMGKMNSNFSDNPPDCLLLTSYISHLYPWIMCHNDP